MSTVDVIDAALDRKDVYGVDEQGEKYLLGNLSCRAYQDNRYFKADEYPVVKFFQNNRTNKTLKLGTGSANVKDNQVSWDLIDPWTVHEQVMNELKLTPERYVLSKDGTTTVITYSYPDSYTVTNPIPWDAAFWKEHHPQAKDNVVKHVGIVTIPLNGAIHLQEGGLWLWCLNGATIFKSFRNFTFSHGNWRIEDFKNAWKSFNVRSNRELTQAVQGRFLPAQTPSSIQRIESAITTMTAIRRKDEVYPDADLYPLSAFEAMKVWDGRGQLGSKWFTENVLKHLRALPLNTRLTLGYVEGVITNAINEESFKSKSNDITRHLNSQKKLVKSLALLLDANWSGF